jgi:hypothetical protein
MNMRVFKYTSWQDGKFFIGLLNEYSEYLTQGLTNDELIENLKSLLFDIEPEYSSFIQLCGD